VRATEDIGIFEYAGHARFNGDGTVTLSVEEFNELVLGHGSLRCAAMEVLRFLRDPEEAWKSLPGTRPLPVRLMDRLLSEGLRVAPSKDCECMPMHFDRDRTDDG